MKFKDFFLIVKNSLSNNFDIIDNWFEMSESLRKYRPQNNGWTINEILEHISLTNHFLLILINKSKDKAMKTLDYVNANEFVYDEGILNQLEDIGKHKSFKWIRPEHMEPKGIVNLEIVRSTIKVQIKTCFEILDRLKNGEGLNVKTKMSVHNLGKIDVYQYIYFLSLHGKRHIEQMQKNKLEYENKKEHI